MVLGFFTQSGAYPFGQIDGLRNLIFSNTEKGIIEKMMRLEPTSSPLQPKMSALYLKA